MFEDRQLCNTSKQRPQILHIFGEYPASHLSGWLELTIEGNNGLTSHFACSNIFFSHSSCSKKGFVGPVLLVTSTQICRNVGNTHKMLDKDSRDIANTFYKLIDVCKVTSLIRHSTQGEGIPKMV